VVPHEVAGMANHAKNIFVGAGGAEMINKTHMLSAVFDMERMMGRDHTPVRRVFDMRWSVSMPRDRCCFC
jgi:nickel-dependent lactate racemase